MTPDGQNPSRTALRRRPGDFCTSVVTPRRPVRPAEHADVPRLHLAAGDDADPRPRWTCQLTGEVVGVLGT